MAAAEGADGAGQEVGPVAAAGGAGPVGGVGAGGARRSEGARGRPGAIPAGDGGSLGFARAARLVADVARAEGWVVPGFRSPPRLAGVARTVRRRSDGGAVVAVAVRGRPWEAMAADLVEGVVVTNRLSGPAAHRCRARLWEALAPAGARAA